LAELLQLPGGLEIRYRLEDFRRRRTGGLETVLRRRHSLPRLLIYDLERLQLRRRPAQQHLLLTGGLEIGRRRVHSLYRSLIACPETECYRYHYLAEGGLEIGLLVLPHPGHEPETGIHPWLLPRRRRNGDPATVQQVFLLPHPWFLL
jgi:hypothetical protein